jgi:hypothetical protein
MKADKQRKLLQLLSTGRYSAAAGGDILSHFSTWGKPRAVPKVLRSYPSNGYKQYLVYLDRKAITTLGHVLVWLQHKGAFAAHLQINHKDGNKQNNALSNLELVTQKENAEHAVRMGLYKVGEECGRSKFTLGDVVVMRALWNTGDFTQQRLADIFSGSKAGVNHIIKRRVWKHV